MKTTVIAGVLVAAALWSGYAFGYHRGAKNERQLWESTREVTQLPGQGGDPTRIRARMLYRNPHLGMFVVSTPGLAVVNQPDPRTYR